MSLGSAPKNAGRKPSTRKRTNKKKPPVTQVIDLFEEVTAEPVETPNQIPQEAPRAPQFPNRPGPVFHLPSVVSGSGGPQVPQLNPPIQPPIMYGLRRTAAQHLAYQLPSEFSGSPQVPQQHISTQIPTISPQNSSSFGLKWVLGTTVSRCYWCGGDIQNPPQTVADNLVVVHKDIR